MQCTLTAATPWLDITLVGSGTDELFPTLAAARVRAQATVPTDWMKFTRSDDGAVVVQAELLALPEWPFLRVRLAESGRFFSVVARRADSALCVRALRDGAYEAFGADDSPERIRDAICQTQAAEKLWRRLFEPTENRKRNSQLLLGRSSAMNSLRQLVDRVAPTNATVLVLGESGVGKERVAEAMHAKSGRKPFIALNCAAIPRDLLETELFGSARGAFTGATEDRPGLVEQADGGTLFLDELGEMDRQLQPKLLRFLETRRARRVGGKSDYAVDVRVIAATNVDLRERAAAGHFREDLYYRVAEIVLEVPALRERPEDIPALCQRFLADAAVRHGKPVSGVEPALVEKLMRWSWPGNVRELRNAIERMVVLLGGPVLGAGAWEAPAPLARPERVVVNASSVRTAAGLSRTQLRALAFKLMDENSDDYGWVAAQLSIHPTTLYRWRKQAGRA